MVLNPCFREVTASSNSFEEQSDIAIWVSQCGTFSGLPCARWRRWIYQIFNPCKPPAPITDSLQFSVLDRVDIDYAQPDLDIIPTEMVEALGAISACRQSPAASSNHNNLDCWKTFDKTSFGLQHHHFEPARDTLALCVPDVPRKGSKRIQWAVHPTCIQTLSGACATSKPVGIQPLTCSPSREATAYHLPHIDTLGWAPR